MIVMLCVMEVVLAKLAIVAETYLPIDVMRGGAGQAANISGLMFAPNNYLFAAANLEITKNFVDLVPNSLYLRPVPV